MGVIAVTVRMSGWALDQWPHAYRLLYPLGGLMMAASAMVYCRIRVRRERAMMRRSARRPAGRLVGWRLLREDRAYRHFMFWQMLHGSMPMMTLPVMVATTSPG